MSDAALGWRANACRMTAASVCAVFPTSSSRVSVSLAAGAGQATPAVLASAAPAVVVYSPPAVNITHESTMDGVMWFSVSFSRPVDQLKSSDFEVVTRNIRANRRNLTGVGKEYALSIWFDYSQTCPTDEGFSVSSDGRWCGKYDSRAFTHELARTECQPYDLSSVHSRDHALFLSSLIPSSGFAW